MVPANFNCCLKELVGFLTTLQNQQPTPQYFLGGYVFAAGVYIFIGTLQKVCTEKIEKLPHVPKAIGKLRKDFYASIPTVL